MSFILIEIRFVVVDKTAMVMVISTVRRDEWLEILVFMMRVPIIK